MPACLPPMTSDARLIRGLLMEIRLNLEAQELDRSRGSDQCLSPFQNLQIKPIAKQ